MVVKPVLKLAAVDPDTPIGELLNLGPVSVKWLVEIGVHTAGELEEMGVIKAYLAVKKARPGATSLNFLWAMQGGLMGMNCVYLPVEVKEAMLGELEAAEA